VATIFRLRSGSWRVQIRRAGERAISKVFEKKVEAVDWSRVMEGSRDNISAFPDAEARKRNVGQAIDAFMLAYTGRDVSIVRRLGWWKDRYGTTPLVDFNHAARIKDALRDLAREDARRWAGKAKPPRSLGKKKGPATCNRYLQSISSVLSWCVDENWIQKNAALGIKRRPEPAGRVRYLSNEERERLLAACDAQADWPDLPLLVRLALSTGARLSELLALRWQDIDIKAKVARIPTSKNSEPRVLPLLPPVLERLEAKPRPIQKSTLLFHAERDTKRTNKTWRKAWESAVAAAKLDSRFVFHDLRHSCASELAMAGASPLEIGDVLGHRTLVMVRRYAHLSHEHKAALVARVLSEKVR
jgi:integrase